MARKVDCVCGRSFHIGNSTADIQCRKCGRWYSGRELGPVQMVTHVLLGGEVARSRKATQRGRRSNGRSHKGQQTRRRPRNLSPVGSLFKAIFG